MTTERYIEIYSRHRNRTMFPHPSQFEIPFAAETKRVYDPVLNGMIYFTEDFSNPLDTGILGNGSNDTVLVLHSSSSLSPIPDYYNGCVIMITTGSGLIARVITGYQPSSLSVIVNVSCFGILPNQSYVIYELNTPSMIHFMIDLQGAHADLLNDDQACTGYYVMDETLSYGSKIVARKINYYDPLLRYAYYEEDMPPDWQLTDLYTIRKTLPYEKWTLSTPSVMSNGFLYITLPPQASGGDRFYVGTYVYFYTSYDIFSTYSIIAYDGFTRQLTCMKRNSDNHPFPTTGDTINIVTFSHDNFSPLSYNGSLVSQNQVVCYEIALLRLTLPNVVLTSGGRIAFYPYVYVEFSNITSPSAVSREIIYSNNPESGRALFLVPVRDMVLPANSHFVKLVGRMKQTVKFKPNDSFRFSVYLADGTPFLPLQQDLQSPYEPNFRLQINATFSIRRL